MYYNCIRNLFSFSKLISNLLYFRFFFCLFIHYIHFVIQKCLNTLDLTSLGIGSCCGTGMYLVAGMVAKNIAGPGVIISFIIAAIASIFSGNYFLYEINFSF